MDDKLKARIEKLRALAERGIGGEKTTAQKKLNELLEKNGVTLEGLTEDEEQYFLFSYNGKIKERLLKQCMYKVLGYEKWRNAITYRTKGTRQKIGIYCTLAEKIEIELEYEFYSNIFDTEEKDFMSAFISAQDIYPKDAPTANLNDYTAEELKKIEKRLAYCNGIEKRTRTAMIEQQN